MKNTIRATPMLLAGWLVLMGAIPVFSGTMTLPAGTTLHVVLETTITTKENKVGDPFRSRMVMPVFINEREALPIGCVVEGTVASLKGPGRVKGKAEMQLRPEKLTFPDGREVSLTAALTGAQTDSEIEVDPREGTIRGPDKEGMDKRGAATGAVMGAGVGAAMGGGKGALIGAGAVGAVALLHQVFKRGKDADLPAGTEIILELTRAVSFPTMEEVPPSSGHGPEPQQTH